MKTLLLTLLIMTSIPTYSQKNDSVTKLIIEMEEAALNRWINGDPSGFLEIYAKDIVYFDPFMELRSDGLEKLTELYESIRGAVHADKYDMINPNVQAVDNMAVLTFNYISYSGETTDKWNCTEVYRKDNDNKWRIIQSHWSYTKPNLNLQ